MAEGVSRNMNLLGPLEALKQSLQGVREEAGKPVDIPVRIVGADRAKAEIEGITGLGAVGDGRNAPGGHVPPPILSHDQDWILHPSHRRHHGSGAWDGPEDYSGASSDRLAGLASEGWDKILGGGAYHTLQEAGRFGRKWGSFLDQGKAGEQRGWADAAATPEGRAYMDSMEDTERLGKKIATLLREIGQGGTGAVKAAEDLKKAQKALEEVGQAGLKAADGLGGDMGGKLRAELEVAQASASSGKGTPDGEGLDPRSILNMVRNPQGALMQGLEQGLLSKLTGLSPAAMGILGGGAAVAGGAYLGWKFNEARADDAMGDGEAMGEDVRFSRSMGRSFDFRGSYWHEDGGRRSRAKEGVNSVEGKKILGSMGLGWDNVKGDPTRLTGRILEYAMDNGLESTDLGGALGAAVSSGQVKRDTGSMEAYLAKMTGHLQRMTAQGVTSNTALQSIASLNSQQVQALGRLTEGGGAFNANLLEALSKTGDPALKGSQGASAAARLGSSLSGNQIPMVMGEVMSDEELRNQLFRDFKGKDAERYIGMDQYDQIMAINKDPAMLRYLKMRALNSGKFDKIPLSVAGNLLGVSGEDPLILDTIKNNPNFSNDKLVKMARDEKDGVDPAFQRGAKGIQGEGEFALSVGEWKSLELTQRATEASIEAAERMKGAAMDLNDVTRKLSQTLDDVQTGRLTDPDKAMDRKMHDSAIRAWESVFGKDKPRK